MREEHTFSARCAWALLVPLALLISVAVTTPVRAADDLAAQRAAVEQLLRAQLPSGLLDFDMDFLAGKGAGSGQNTDEKLAFIARQAGTAYGIAKYYEQTRDANARVPLERLIERLGALSLPIGKSPMQRAVEATRVLSLPLLRTKLRNALEGAGLLYTRSGTGALVAYEQGYATAWAGTTALALLAELHYFRASGDARFAALRERWREGLDALRIPGRGFRELPDTIDESAYANGEAWLAHAVYIETFPGGRVSPEEMRGIDDYMIDGYGGEFSAAFFHWGAMTAARRFRVTDDRRFLDFLAQQGRMALESGPPADSPVNSCGLVEGLAAVAGALSRGGRAAGDLHGALRQRIRGEMDKNGALQLRPGQDRLDFGADSYLHAPRLASYAGAYLIGRYTPAARIDATQHCISAVTEMQYP